MSTVFDEAVLEERPEIDLSVLADLRAENEQPVVLAVDIGTSGARSALFDSRGNQLEESLVAVSSEAYSSLISGNDVDPETLVELVAQMLDLTVARAELFVSRIDYVASACFWHSLLGVDEGGQAVTPLLGWADLRASEAVAELRDQLPESKFHPSTGCRFHSSYWPAKLKWLARTQPEAVKRVSRWLSFSDYLFLRLFGDATTSLSMASATGLLDQSTCEWQTELLDALRISRSQLPQIAAPAKTFRGLRREHSLRWPMLDRAAWFPAIGDGAANNIGSGGMSRDQIVLMLGTSGAMRMLSSRVAPATLPPELFCYRADRERVVIGGALSDGGSLLSWMKNALTLDFEDDEINRLLEGMLPDSHGLTILPFWSGERATGWSTSARGAIIGLTARTSPMDIVRAVMESVCYRFALIARALDSFATDAAITLAGKIFLSYPSWARIMADVLGRRIELSPIREATTRGAALLALETIGTIDSLETIMVEPGRVIEPDMQRHKVYARAIERQQKVYDRLIT